MAIDGRNGSRGMNQEDTTATEVFQELRENERGVDVDVVFEETPEEVMARADEPDPEPTVEEDLRPDEDELESLLLPGREMEEGFLWVIADGGL